LCAAAALASLKVIQEEKLVDHSAKMGAILESELKRIQQKFGARIGAADAKGLVATLQIVTPGTTDPDSPTAQSIVKLCIEKGLLMFAPVGVGGGTVKISPPLITPEDALREGIAVLEESIEQTFKGGTR
jgi:4-aminobutyrate aminotransferase-like enzyme